MNLEQCQTWVTCLGLGLYLRHHDTSSLSSGPGFLESGPRSEDADTFIINNINIHTALLMFQAGSENRRWSHVYDFLLYILSLRWDGRIRVLCSHRVNRCFSWDQFWHFQVGFIFCVLCSTYNGSVCFLFRMQTARILVILIAENMIFQSALDFKKIRFNRRLLFQHNTHI